MKRSASIGGDRGQRRPGVRWDEENLEENERLKAELNPAKIDEPKTPYLSPMETTTDEEPDVLHGPGVAPLSLHGGGMPSAVRARSSAWSDSSDHNGGSPSPRAGPSSAAAAAGGSGGRSSSRSPRFSEYYYKGSSDEEVEGCSDPQRKERRQRFRDARKAHYHMRAALRRPTEALDEEEQEDGRSAVERGGQGWEGWKVGVGVGEAGRENGHGLPVADGDADSEGPP